MNDTVGEVSQGGHPSWVYDMQAGFPVMWTLKAAELDRMVRLGHQALEQDQLALREAVALNVAPPVEPSVFYVTFFLAALAIENLLKGVLVFSCPECVQDGRLRGDVITKHDLVRIAQKAKFELSSEETSFCKIGTEAILSFGRYHVGKDMNDTISRMTIRNSAFLVYEGLYKRLWKHIESNPVPPKRS